MLQEHLAHYGRVVGSNRAPQPKLFKCKAGARFQASQLVLRYESCNHTPPLWIISSSVRIDRPKAAPHIRALQQSCPCLAEPQDNSDSVQVPELLFWHERLSGYVQLARSGQRRSL